MAETDTASHLAYPSVEAAASSGPWSLGANSRAVTLRRPLCRLAVRFQCCSEAASQTVRLPSAAATATMLPYSGGAHATCISRSSASLFGTAQYAQAECWFACEALFRSYKCLRILLLPVATLRMQSLTS